MERSTYHTKSQLLQQLMKNAGISTLQELSNITHITELKLIKLQHGLLLKLPLELTINVASALKISIQQFIKTFTSSPINFVSDSHNEEAVKVLESLEQEHQRLQAEFEVQKASLTALESLEQEYQRLQAEFEAQTASLTALESLEQEHQNLQAEFEAQKETLPTIEALEQEYQRLQGQLEAQKETLHQEFQQESLQVLESWLLQWPTAIAIVKKNPQLPVERILPLIKPVEQLVEKWSLTKIAMVGEEVAYNPRQHELIKGMAEIGDRVKVRYVGYKQGDKLLYRAKVSAIEEK